jgi:hypothetical protein
MKMSLAGKENNTVVLGGTDLLMQVACCV